MVLWLLTNILERGMFSEAAFVSISHFLTATAASDVRFSYGSPLLRVNWEISESFPCSLYRLTRGSGGYAELLTTHNQWWSVSSITVQLKVVAGSES